MTRITRSYIAPNPKEFEYWVDLSADPKGNVIKYYAGGSKWLPLNDDTDNDQSEAIKELQNTTKQLTTKVNKLTSDVDEILVKTKEEYEALEPKATTLYLIPEEK